MSIFAAQQTSFFTPPSYAPSPLTKTETPPVYKTSYSTLSIPSSLSKLSFSLEPVKRIFTFSSSTSNDTRDISPPASHFSAPSTANSSSSSLSEISTETTHQDQDVLHLEEISQQKAQGQSVTVPPPTYSPIKAPKPSTPRQPETTQPRSPEPPAYEVSTSDLETTATAQLRPQTPATRGVRFAGPYSDYEGYGYVAESWAGARSNEDMRREREKKEEEEEDGAGCWKRSGCDGWWWAQGSPGMPWVAYYVF